MDGAIKPSNNTTHDPVWLHLAKKKKGRIKDKQSEEEEKETEYSLCVEKEVRECSSTQLSLVRVAAQCFNDFIFLPRFIGA